MPGGEFPRILREPPPPEILERDLEGFLTWLEGPTVFHLKGDRSDRVRMLSGGLHGNEPSGFYAIHELLKAPPRLATDTVLVIGNVRAALHEVPFTHRFIPGEEDMNRVWSDPVGSALREEAARIHEHLKPMACEAFVDLHNNTGDNPIYAVVIERDERRVALGRPWTHRFVVYEGTRLGTFLEVCEPRAPGVVIECGQAGDPEADRRALAGARKFLSTDNPFDQSQLSGDEYFYRSTARVTVPEDVELAFNANRTVADLTVSPDIDRFNFRVMAAGSRLAYCNNGRMGLVVIDNDGEDATDRYLEVVDGEVRLRRALIPVMMTTDAVSAKCDCLLYAAQRIEVTESWKRPDW